jgi:hypothetical protein
MYEPKWDGFRCLVFRDHENIFLQSKAGKSLTSAFPEIVEALVGRVTRLLIERNDIGEASNRRAKIEPTGRHGLAGEEFFAASA